MIQGWYCGEKLDTSYSWGLNGCNECLNEEINEWTETWRMNQKNKQVHRSGRSWKNNEEIERGIK